MWAALIFLAFPAWQQFELQVFERVIWRAGVASRQDGSDPVGERVITRRIDVAMWFSTMRRS
jgi:hypothetical protein